MSDRSDEEVLATAADALRRSPVAVDDVLANATAALRDVSQASPPDVAATRLRVMGSLERRGLGRRKRVVAAAVLATLGTGTLSWAAATGRVQRVIEALVEPDPDYMPVYGPPAPARDAVAAGKKRVAVADVETPAVPDPVPVPDPAPAVLQTTTTPEMIPVPEGTGATEPAPLPPPRPARRAPKKPDLVVDDSIDRDLYRRAHALHFHGADAETALAAWDRYLAERPAGRFAIEARYNRAIVLVRLDRRDDARAALAPFADGSIEPAGYRQREARELLAAMEHAPAAETP